MRRAAQGIGKVSRESGGITWRVAAVAGVALFVHAASWSQAAPSSNARRAAAPAVATPVAVGATASQAATQRTIDVPVRGNVPLTLPGAPARIAVGDPEVADVQVLSGEGGRAGSVLIVGKKPGATTLRVWQRGNAAPDVWNLRVSGDIEQALAARGMQTGITTDHGGGKSVLSGLATSAQGHEAARLAAAQASGSAENVVDLSNLDTSGVVQVEVKVVEVSRSALKEVGVSFGRNNGPWQFQSGLGDFPTAGVGAVLQNGFNVLYGTNSVNATLRLLQTNGMARILAEPTLLALSGQSASFLAGGEIPIPESGGLGTTTVVYKPFGIGLTVTPTVLSRDRIALKVAPEASELDFVNAIPIVNGTTTSLIPALRTRRADTMVELGDGESFVISGLVSRQTTAAVEKIPLLGDLPIIGAFFRSMRYSQEDRELVILVTPRLVRPIARGVTLPLPGAAQERSDTAFNAWGNYLLGPIGGEQMPGFSR